MNLILGENERLVGQYPYVKTKQIIEGKKDKKEEVVIEEKELFITNKRVVVATNRPHSSEKQQINIDQISGFDAYTYYKDESKIKGKFGGFLLILFGLVFCCAIIGLIFVFGIKMIKKGVKIIKNSEHHNTTCTLELNFYGTNEFREILNVDAHFEKKGFKTTTKKEKKSNKKGNKENKIEFEVEMNPNVAKQMVDKIGADLLEAKK